MKLLQLSFLFFFAWQAQAQFNPDSLKHVEVLGFNTDPYVNGDLGKKHQAFYNPTSTSRNTLLLHLVGSYDNPNSTILFPTMATENGFHAVNLMYRNWTAAQTACGDTVDVDCYLNFRKEIIEGIDYSTEIDVNVANSIENRLLKLLEYLNDNYPNQNWNQFYSGTTLLWDKMIVSGHSQGGGHAAVIGISKPIQRVLMFASPNDYSDTLNTVASWTGTSHVIADSNYYGFNALNDDVVDFWKQMEAWDAIGLDNLGDTVNVDQVNYPYEFTRQLYTKAAGGFSEAHSLMIRDDNTPLDGTNTPIFFPVWKYMLGIEDPSMGYQDVSQPDFNFYPNPTSDYVQIKGNVTNQKFNVRIYDLSGKMCLETFNQQLISLVKLKSGGYFLEVLVDESPIGYEKLIISR